MTFLRTKKSSLIAFQNKMLPNMHNTWFPPDQNNPLIGIFPLEELIANSTYNQCVFE